MTTAKWTDCYTTLFVSKQLVRNELRAESCFFNEVMLSN